MARASAFQAEGSRFEPGHPLQDLLMRILTVKILCLVSFSAFGKTLTSIEGERFILDLKYNSRDNFLKRNLYRDFKLEKCWAVDELANRLKKLIPILSQKKLKLVLWDCYRPLEVQKALWKLVPDARYVADPKVGSNHNRGAAIDVALADETGGLRSFPTPFDDFTYRASPKYQCSEEEKAKCQNRDELIELMKRVGLEVFPTEWWHFQLPKAETLSVIKNFE